MKEAINYAKSNIFIPGPVVLPVKEVIGSIKNSQNSLTGTNYKQ